MSALDSLETYCGWTESVRTTLKPWEMMVGWHVQGNRILPGLLGWCRISSIHTVDGQHPAPVGNHGKPLFVGIYRGIETHSLGFLNGGAVHGFRVHPRYALAQVSGPPGRVRPEFPETWCHGATQPKVLVRKPRTLAWNPIKTQASTKPPARSGSKSAGTQAAFLMKLKRCFSPWAPAAGSPRARAAPVAKTVSSATSALLVSRPPRPRSPKMGMFLKRAPHMSHQNMNPAGESDA